MALRDVLDETAPYPIRQLLYSYLTIPDICLLGRMCKSFRWLPKHLSRSLLNIDTHLQPFITDPQRFRDRLGRFDGIISRGFALNFFFSGCQKTPYLDVFVEKGVKADAFVCFLKLEELYELPESQHHVDDEVRETILLRNAERQTTIRLTLTNGFPLLHILQTACATAELNFITRDKAYSLFPSLTIHQHKFYLLRRLDDDSGCRLSEYAHHGWTTRDVMWPDWTDKMKLKGKGCRRVGHRFSLVVELPGNFGTPSSTPHYVIEHAQFGIQGTVYMTRPNRGKRRDDEFELEAKPFTSHALRHCYTIANSWSWGYFLSGRLERWLMMELFKMGHENRPGPLTPNTPYYSFKVSLPLSITPPSTWDHADDQVPIWYAEWAADRRW
uniref:F-box domain-containing protein n=1 Tax=Colletotrichum fructicola (strain Nara gc5) TaxID=1213859 RepID=L2FEJ4_COLFN